MPEGPEEATVDWSAVERSPVSLLIAWDVDRDTRKATAIEERRAAT